MPPLGRMSLAVALTVSITHKCSPGGGTSLATTMCRLSGSQLNPKNEGVPEAQGGAMKGGLSDIGTIHKWFLANPPPRETPCTAIFEPSGAKRMEPSINLWDAMGGFEYWTGGLPGGDESHRRYTPA